MIPRNHIILHKAIEIVELGLFGDKIAELKPNVTEINAERRRESYEAQKADYLNFQVGKKKTVGPRPKLSPEDLKLIESKNLKSKELRALNLQAIGRLQSMLYEEELKAKLLNDDGNMHPIPRNIWASKFAPKIFYSGRATFKLGGQSLSGQVILGDSDLNNMLSFSSTPQLPTFRFNSEKKEWEFSWEGVSATHSRDLKGLRYLWTLLSSPNKKIHAIDLTDSAGTDFTPNMQRARVLDNDAIKAIKDKINNLFAESQGLTDPEKSLEIKEEIAALKKQLMIDTGRRGVGRKFNDDNDRARKAVQKNIANTYKVLDEKIPSMADYLHTFIVTGEFSVYNPEISLTWLL
jgi:hypothetical protein